MSAAREWEAANERYLAAALRWLRELLERSAGGPDHSAATEAIDHAAHAVAEAEAADAPPALLMLGERLGLSRFERDTLLLCAAMELDPQMAALCARAQPGSSPQPYPTFALALAIFDDPAWDALSPDRPLRYWRLIEISQPGALPLTASALRADERIVNYIKGLNTLDDRLQRFVAPLESDDTAALVAPSQQPAVDAIVRRGREGSAGCIQLVGADAASQRLAAARAAATLGLMLLRVPAAWLPSDLGDLDTLARLWRRDSRLLPIAMFLDAHAADESAGAATMTSVNRLVTHGVGFALVSLREPMPIGPSLVVDVNRPTATEQQQTWRAALGEGSDRMASALAAQFNLDLPAIVDIAIRHTASDDPQSVWRDCLARTRPSLDRLAARIDPLASWRDLVLPAEQRRLLYQIARQARQRGRVYDDWGFRRRSARGLGITALFAGDSGTGKTMAAEVIARHLGLDLYRIDLSAVVSKYIGETEKNLRRLFDAAEGGGVILFFDEADALFGRRSEVKDSHDRYANIEINYLLQRMESFSGVAILATNLKSALDPAFLRRLRFIVNFPFPAAAERRALWRKAFPAEAPVERHDPATRLDIERLSGLSLTGGSIHNIAVNAAFLAAGRNGRITGPVVAEAIKTELRKLDRPVSDAELGIGRPPRRMHA
jgi:hypothetical protein